MNMCVYVWRANSEVSFFCLHKLLSLNSILWLAMMFYLTFTIDIGFSGGTTSIVPKESAHQRNP